MNITTSVKDDVWAKLELAILKKLSSVVNKVTVDTYNYIVNHSYPYWSGQYVNSWSVSFGTKNYSYLPSAGKSFYPKPRPMMDTNGMHLTGYVLNSAPHGYKVEYEGTPTHPTPWHIATEARNNIVLKYNFS